MNMIKQVAIALYGADGFGADDASHERQKHYKLLARAAIDAMREPTVNMTNAADLSDALKDGSSAYGCWSTMIDAALNEE